MSENDVIGSNIDDNKENQVPLKRNHNNQKVMMNFFGGNTKIKQNSFAISTNIVKDVTKLNVRITTPNVTSKAPLTTDQLERAALEEQFFGGSSEAIRESTNNHEKINIHTDTVSKHPLLLGDTINYNNNNNENEQQILIGTAGDEVVGDESDLNVHAEDDDSDMSPDELEGINEVQRKALIDYAETETFCGVNTSKVSTLLSCVGLEAVMTL